jgi:hypothetical protein
MKPMDKARRQRVEANLFQAARPAVEPWDKFPWHTSGEVCDTDQVHSSRKPGD